MRSCLTPFLSRWDFASTCFYLIFFFFLFYKSTRSQPKLEIAKVLLGPEGSQTKNKQVYIGNYSKWLLF